MPPSVLPSVTPSVSPVTVPTGGSVAWGSLSPTQQLIDAIYVTTRGNPGGVPSSELQAAMLTGAFYESDFNPTISEPDSGGMSYGAYSFHEPGGELTTLEDQGYSPQAAIMIAQNPWQSTVTMLKAYEAGVKKANWSQGMALGAAQAAALAERPAEPYGTAAAKQQGVPVRQVVEQNYTDYIVPAAALSGSSLPPATAPGTTTTTTTAHAANLPGLGGLLQQFDGLINPRQPTTVGTGLPGISLNVSVFVVIGLRAIVALPGVVGILMAAASGLLGLAGGRVGSAALNVVPGGSVVKGALKGK